MQDGNDGDGDGNNGDEDADKDDESSKDSKMEDADNNPIKDPKNVGTGKYYKPQTPKGKAMAKMFRRFCDLPTKDTNTILIYFDVCNV